ncbi:hypothetical protein CPAR01_04173, partial [Colletotrichum paranaense]
TPFRSGRPQKISPSPLAWRLQIFPRSQACQSDHRNRKLLGYRKKAASTTRVFLSWQSSIVPELLCSSHIVTQINFKAQHGHSSPRPPLKQIREQRFAKLHAPENLTSHPNDPTHRPSMSLPLEPRASS